MTNFEKIKAMSVEGMAKFLYNLSKTCSNDGACVGCPLESAGDCTDDDIKEWLENEAEN